MGKKVERGGRGLTGVFGHHDTGGNVETEV
jgi:hypothetical protein